MSRMPKIKSNDIFHDIEYLTISRAGKKYYTFAGDEIEGMTKLELQKKIGEMFGDEKFNCSIKTKGEFNNKTFSLPGIVIGQKKEFNNSKEIPGNNSNLNFNFILEKLETNHKDNINRLENIYNDKIDLLVNQNKKDLENLLKNIEEKQKYILDLEKEIDKVNNNEQTDMTKTMQMIGMVKSLMSGNVTNQTLSDKNDKNNSSDIPKEFIDLFSSIDYTKINQSDLQNYYNILNQFVSSLPKKEFKQ